MACLRWIHKATKSPFLRSVDHIPFIVGDDGEYIDGFNQFLHLRCQGLITRSSGDDSEVAVQFVCTNSVIAIAYRLTNFVSWLYCTSAHPQEGIIHWSAIERWHYTELYRDAMVAGLWTKNYWLTGIPVALNFPSTIGQRIKEIAACHDWMIREGLVESRQVTRSLSERQKSSKKAVLGYRDALEDVLRIIPRTTPPKRRLDPGDWGPLPAKQLAMVMSFLPPGPIRLSVAMLLSNGLRSKEHVDNTLVPGELHLRSPEQIRSMGTTFPKTPYRLAYRPSDNKMIGVLPSPEASFEASADAFLEYRVLGKGRKIRSVIVSAVLMRKIWRYFAGPRGDLLKKGPQNIRSAMFLNRRGAPITKRNIAYALAEARRKTEMQLGAEIHLTPHVLRHTFARLFLEANLAAIAKKQGLDLSKISVAKIEELASGPLLVLQELLGHALPKDTVKYLRQMSKSIIGLEYQRAFLEAIDKEVLDGA